ncbi:MAG: tetratricopeptide repeat protein [Acidobacteria bacterium]|nr:tetratricopeptide repeat protein [Acidobacteriota bacterium]
MNICQRCLTLNNDMALFCHRCGAELVPPIILEHHKEEVAHLLEDSLHLGRISSLEMNQDTVRKDVEELVDYLEKHSLNNLHLAVTVDKLIQSLDQAGIIQRKELENQIRDEMQGNLFGFEQRMQLQERVRKIVEGRSGSRSPRLNALLQRAIAALYTSRHSQGVRLLQRALKMAPRDRDLIQILAEIHFITGDYGEALLFLSRLKAVVPHSVPANLLLALIYMKKGNYRRALRCLTAAQKAAPGTFTIQFLMGVVNFLLRDFQHSAHTFQAAYAIRPLPQLTLLSSMAFYLGDSPGRADSVTRQARTRLNRSGFYHFLAGLISRRCRWNRKAESHFRQAIRQNRKWKNLLEEIDRLEPDLSRQKQTQLFTSRLHREMEDLMGLLISEIQNLGT